MFDFIPLEYYTPLYYHISLLIVIFTFAHTQTHKLGSRSNFKFNNSLGISVFIFILLYMGLRPISGIFTDMFTYNRMFIRYSYGDSITSTNDVVFHIFTKFCSQIMNAQTYFFICAVLYIIPLYLVCKKWFKEYWYYAFLMLVVSFSFWPYGVNGIRNGIATSLFLFGLSRDKRLFQIIWILLAIGFHKTMMLPALGFVLTWFYNKPKGFFYFWFLSIPLSLALPDFWENLFATLGEDDRMAYLTTQADDSKFSSTGFRWDFLAYSAAGVFAGWYYIFKKKLNDPLYNRLFNIFLFANAFWILVIRAIFSNRFAYLSWFMMGIIIIYPWLREYFIKNQHSKIGFIIVSYFLFTYILNLFL